MHTYTVRVELHASTYSYFELLHSQMERQGFTRRITASDGKVYHLPRAEYNISTSKACADVLELTERVVAAVGCTGEVLVTESIRRMWSGLTQVK